MDPSEIGPQGGGGSIEICLSSAVNKDNLIEEVNAPDLDPMVDIEQTVMKTETSPSEVSTDEASKILEDCETVINGEEKSDDVDGEEKSDDINGEEKSDDVNGDLDVVSSGENSGDSESGGSESAEPELEPESLPIEASDVIKSKSDIEIEDDPLEFARQVAIEVEREVEESLNSSDGAPEEPPVSQLPETENFVQEELENAIPEIEHSQQVLPDAEKSVCDFDLNDEVISVEKIDDEVENEISEAPAMAAYYPLQFAEVNFGWKRSVPTGRSTFHSGDESDSSPRKRENCLDIDLNNHESFYQPPTIEKPELDLNCETYDGVDGTSYKHQAEGQIRHLSNGNYNLQALKQPGFLSFDLNENYLPVANKSVVSIMGVQVEVKKKDRVSNSLPFFSGLGLSPDPGPFAMPPTDADLAQTGGVFGLESAVPYNQSSFYTGLTPAAFSQYGHFPYMFDSGGSSVTPQVQPGFLNPHHPMMGMRSMPVPNGVGSSGFNLFNNSVGGPVIPEFQSGFPSNSHTMMGGMASMTGSNGIGPSGGFNLFDSGPHILPLQGFPNPHPMIGMSSMPNGAGSSGSSGFNLGMIGMSSMPNGAGSSGSSGFNLDLNVGSHDGNRDNNGGIREYYPPPFAGMKRSEPESGWEPELYPPFKHHQQNWE